MTTRQRNLGIVLILGCWVALYGILALFVRVSGKDAVIVPLAFIIAALV
jgi:hypothetical protein